MIVRMPYFKIFGGTPRITLSFVCEGNSIISYIVIETYTDIEGFFSFGFFICSQMSTLKRNECVSGKVSYLYMLSL